MTTPTNEHRGTGFPTFATQIFDGAYNVHPFDNLTKDHMLAVEPRCLRRTQKELGTTVGYDLVGLTITKAGSRHGGTYFVFGPVALMIIDQ